MSVLKILVRLLSLINYESRDRDEGKEAKGGHGPVENLNNLNMNIVEKLQWK